MAQQKVEHDFQAVDWCRSKHAVVQGERMILVLRQMMKKSGRTSINEINSWIGGTRRPARTFADQLEKAGYIIGDGQKPEGFVVTEKTKQIFTVKVIG